MAVGPTMSERSLLVEQIRAVIGVKVAGWPGEYERLVAGVSDVELRGALLDLPDEHLRDVIVDELNRWHVAYEALVGYRYHKIVIGAAMRKGGGSLGNLDCDDWRGVHHKLQVHLWDQGLWRPLRRWQKEKGPFYGWFKRVVGNFFGHTRTAHDRRIGREPVSLDEPLAGEGEGSPMLALIPESDATSLDFFAVDDELRRAVLELPSNMRHAVVMRYWLGFTAREIAAALDTSHAAARQRLVKARRLLRESIQHEVGGDS